MTSFERAIDPVLEILLPDPRAAAVIVDFRVDPQMAERIDELAGRSNEGMLSCQEREEYEGYVRANKFLAILKRRAKRIAGSGGGNHG